MRLLVSALACFLLAGCVTTGSQETAPEVAAVPAPVDPNATKAVVASTMEVKVDTSAVGDIKPEKVGKKLALALATITEFHPDTGTAVTPVRSAIVMPDNSDDGSSLKMVYTDNAFRQSVWMDDHDKVLLGERTVDPGWYLVHSFGSTAGFELNKPRNGQRGCLMYGAVPAPGVEPVALKAGEIGYFGHFVITIAVKPGKDAASPYALSVEDATIKPAPDNLDDLLRHNGLNPEYVRRIPADHFPCPWTVPRTQPTLTGDPTPGTPGTAAGRRKS